MGKKTIPGPAERENNLIYPLNDFFWISGLTRVFLWHMLKIFKAEN
jgi:hypothetical protein